ncbi:hypothetical protein Pla52o_44170 [Novipirellula galeiformis]|uniref:Methyltransferase type 11 domain-containing protein n=1 Tax=Novipirellula galeiformis TaxID=2528004 RepID=A0A5C6CCH1_9BACT|nr:methyltransferase domain-containing protein [Novipirellula galeiformis]TWU20539.1 hypothetical protein Pla52o_44170 [Novipirellula galeiformis]
MTQPSAYLNVGCGNCYHPDWTNVDLVASGPEVYQCDLRRGLPYEAEQFAAVYHSHVLEHLTPDNAATMLRDCFRVLRPGGIIRVVVPDLEGIATAYLQTLNEADGGDEKAIANHQWMTLELLDQMTRARSGGLMKLAMENPAQINRDFIRSRIGAEMDPAKKAKRTWRNRLSRWGRSTRKQLAATAVAIVQGRSGRDAFREGNFRDSGEIHRWMYDRVSLARLLREVGFENASVVSANESQIELFDSFELDYVGSSPRKPDSLYMEATRPRDAKQTNVGLSRAA